MQSNLLSQPRKLEKSTDLVIQDRSQSIKQELRQRISQILENSQNILSNSSINNHREQDGIEKCVEKYIEQCASTIRAGLLSIQIYCQTVEKKFIFVEQVITCDQHDIGGRREAKAILFRGPNEDASVAICITQHGSLLYRNDSPWMIYRDAGDLGSSKVGDSSQAAVMQVPTV